MATRHLRASAHRLAVASLALCMGAFAGVAPARAQFLDDGGYAPMYALGPYQVRMSLERRGFRVIAPLRRNGQVYVADVMDGMGRHERLIVAISDALILQRFVVDDGLGEAGGYARQPRGGRFAAPEPDYAPRMRVPPPRDADEPGNPDDPDDAGAPRNAPRASVAPASPIPAPPRVKRPPRVVTHEAVDGHDVHPATPAPRDPMAARPSPVAPEPPAAATAGGSGDTSYAPRRMKDPLAIPGEPARGPVRLVAPGITGSPPSGPGHEGTLPPVPAAPLD